MSCFCLVKNQLCVEVWRGEVVRTLIHSVFENQSLAQRDFFFEGDTELLGVLGADFVKGQQIHHQIDVGSIVEMTVDVAERISGVEGD